MTEQQSDLDALEALAKAATPGPWTWSPEKDQWGDCGPNLETVERGPVYQDGSQGAKETVVGSWGHDANGISVSDADKEFIAAADPSTVLALIAELRQERERADEARAKEREAWSVANIRLDAYTDATRALSRAEETIAAALAEEERCTDQGTRMWRILTDYDKTKKEQA